jgi:N-dimethylarginine dimethylaminohydrolase
MTHTHTPGPWRVVDSLNTIDCIGIYGPHSVLVAEIRDPESVKPEERAQEEETMRDNAAFIVRACNAHDELVKALEKVRIFVNGDRSPADMSTATFIIDKALALAGGKE